MGIPHGNLDSPPFRFSAYLAGAKGEAQRRGHGLTLEISGDQGWEKLLSCNIGTMG